MFSNKIYNCIKEHIRSALFSAKEAHSILSAYADSNDKFRIVTSAANYALMGLQSMKAAEVLYQSTSGNDSDDVLEDVFHAYETFCSELVSVLAENESPQWVFIHYDELVSSVKLLHLDLPESFAK